MFQLHKRDDEENEVVKTWSGSTNLSSSWRDGHNGKRLARLFKEIESIRKIVRSPEEEEKVAKSRLSLARALLKKARIPEAKTRLRKVVSEFPNTTAAKDATELLEALGSRE
jgi:hypothetical protein